MLRAPPLLRRARLGAPTCEGIGAVAFFGLRGSPWQGRPEGLLGPELGAAAQVGFGSQRADAVVVDATGVRSVAEVREALWPRLAGRPLSSLRRIVVLGRAAPAPGTGGSVFGAAERSATSGALQGFVRSVAKEVGARGCTANMLMLQDGAAPESLRAPLLWMLSPASAFVTGQVVPVGGGAAGEAEDPFSLEDRRVLVTGATGGIGKRTCRLLKAQGARLILADHPGSRAALDRLAVELSADASVAVDARDAPATSSALCGAVEEAWGGRADALVLGAGVTRDRSLRRMKWSEWDDAIRVNYESPIHTLQEFAGRNLLSEDSRCVFIASISGVAGNGGQSNYAASKSALADFARAYAEEGAPPVRGLTVNSVAPGFIDTKMTAKIPPLQREIFRRVNTLRQGGLPIDVAEAIAFLSATGASAGINGYNLRVCGGHPLGR